MNYNPVATFCPASIDASIVDRFLNKVNKNGRVPKSYTKVKTCCWEWLGAKDRDGYGLFSYSHEDQWKAHRFAYALRHGRKKLKKELEVCHKCDNLGCIRWSHLFQGTSLENSRDMVSKKRSAKGKRHGSHTHPESRHGLKGDLNGARIHIERMPRGSAQWMAKLTEKKVAKIRRLFNSGKYFQNHLAAKFNVSVMTISLIVRDKIWRHVMVKSNRKEK